MKTKRTSPQDDDFWATSDDEEDDDIEIPSNGSSAFGQVIVLVLLGFILLIATNVIELQGEMGPAPEDVTVKKHITTTTSHRPVGLTTRKANPQNVLPQGQKSSVDDPLSDTTQNDKEKPSTSTLNVKHANTEHTNIDTVESKGDTGISATEEASNTQTTGEDETTENTDDTTEPTDDDFDSSSPTEDLGPLPHIPIKDAWLTDFFRLREEEHSRRRHTYVPRGRPMDEVQRRNLTNHWGSWTLVDDKERPTDDYYAKYPNRDIPRSEFPDNAWQIDTDYLCKFLPESLALVERAQEAILAEYGKTEGTWKERTKMFQITKFTDGELPSKGLGPKESSAHKSLRQGGWTTKKSWAGLKRRLLHAIMTEDNFVFAMGGHSGAAGHGNHFIQSYTLQIQWILEAVFARLGVKHEARNFGNGGMGTLQNGLAAGSIYGPDVDMLMWDSGMTEGKDLKAISVMHRQGILGGIKVPILWSLASSITRQLNVDAGVDIGFPGSGHDGVRIIKRYEQLESTPWAMQAVRCSNEMNSVCREGTYMGKCWVDRDDFTPSNRQSSVPEGRATWHPGNRVHQLTGRVIAFTILTALREVLEEWNEADGYVLEDSSWHVTEYYDDMRERVANSPGGRCGELKKVSLGFACRYPVKARTEFTPRAYPTSSSLRSIMPPEMLAEINKPGRNVYEGRDVFNPVLHPPEGAVDVLSIVEAGVDFKPILYPDYQSFYKTASNSKPPFDTIGRGNHLATVHGDDYCDGTVDSTCNRSKRNSCLLSGHNDSRNGIMYHAYSGWLFFNIPDLKNGYIVAKIETWHSEGIGIADSWDKINGNKEVTPPEAGSEKTTKKGSRHRRLKPARNYCKNFWFEYSINGEVKTISLERWTKEVKKVQRVVETVSLLADSEFTGGEEQEVELGMRIRGCGKTKVFKLTHLYWS